jgi:ABC-type transporter Mla maintaining outer membrane lipid asymmetry permease subunit MlaE
VVNFAITTLRLLETYFYLGYQTFVIASTKQYDIIEAIFIKYFQLAIEPATDYALAFARATVLVQLIGS